MTTDVTALVGGYAERVHYGLVDSSGYFIGAASTPAAGNADGSEMARVQGLQDFPFAPVPPDRPTQRGDGGAIARFLFKSAELPEADMTFGADDYVFRALIQSLSVVSHGGGEFILGQPEDPTFQDMVLLAVAPAKDLSGNSIWEARFILKANIQGQGRATFNDNALPTYQYNMVANYGTAYPWGLAFVAGTDGDDKAVYIDFTWPYRPVLKMWQGNAAATSWNLSQNIAEDSATNIIVSINGTAQTWVTGVPGAGEFGVTEGGTDVVVTGSTAGAGDYVHALYGWS